MGKLSPVSSNLLTWYMSDNLSTMAFFIIDWISEGLKSLLFTLLAFLTQNLPSFGINSSHGSAFVPWKSSSKVNALKDPTLIRTLSAVLRQIFALTTASGSPANVTKKIFLDYKVQSTFVDIYIAEQKGQSPFLNDRYGVPTHAGLLPLIGTFF